MKRMTGVEIGTQIPLLQKVGPHWLLWIEYDVTQRKGKFLRLLGDGQIWLEDTSEGKIKIIKPRE